MVSPEAHAGQATLAFGTIRNTVVLAMDVVARVWRVGEERTIRLYLADVYLEQDASCTGIFEATHATLQLTAQPILKRSWSLVRSGN